MRPDLSLPQRPAPPIPMQHQQAHQVRQKATAAPRPPPTHVITVVVGKLGSSKTFVLEESVLRSSSGHVDDILSRPCLETVERVIKLRHASEASFSLYVHFLSTGSLFTAMDSHPSDTLHNGIPLVYHKELEQLASLYHLAFSLEAAGFKDAIVDTLIAVIRDTDVYCDTIANPLPAYKKIFTPRTVQFYYTYSAPGSGVRKLIVDCAIKHFLENREGVDSWYEYRQVDEFMMEFREELGLVSIHDKEKGRIVDPLATDTDMCRYHEHEPGKECCTTRFGFSSNCMV